jgi:hypothetical protein
MGRTSFHGSRDKEVYLYPFPRFLQGMDTQTVADGRKQEGFILLLGKPPHNFQRHLLRRDDRVAKNSLKMSALLKARFSRTGSWPSSLVRTQPAVFLRLRSITCYAIPKHMSICRRSSTAHSQVERSLWT